MLLLNGRTSLTTLTMKKRNHVRIFVILVVALAVAGIGYFAMTKYGQKAANDRVRGRDDRDSEEMKKARAAHEALFAKAETIAVTVDNSSFNAPTFTLEKGKPYKISISAKDSGEHVVRIPAFSIATVVTAKAGAVVYDVVPDKVGETEIICSNHKGEKATLIVK